MKHGPAAKVSRQPASGWVARRTIKRRVAALVHEGFRSGRWGAALQLPDAPTLNFPPAPKAPT